MIGRYEDWESFLCEAPCPQRKVLRWWAIIGREKKRPDSPQHADPAETQLLVPDGLQQKGKARLDGSEVALTAEK